MRLLGAVLAGLVALPLAAMEPVRLGVVVVGGQDRVAKATLAAMRAETSRILNLSELDLVWRDAGGVGTGEVFDRFVVVRLIDAGGDGAQVRGADGPLGTTDVSEGQVLPFVTVDPDRVRQAVVRYFEAAGVAATQQDLGRALGRVLSHEIYHVLSARSDHDTEGLAKPALSGYELTRGEPGFTEWTKERIREGLRR
jgi:hypothetical protein